jgi:hypothetical protein
MAHLHTRRNMIFLCSTYPILGCGQQQDIWYWMGEARTVIPKTSEDDILPLLERIATLKEASAQSDLDRLKRLVNDMKDRVLARWPNYAAVSRLAELAKDTSAVGATLNKNPGLEQRVKAEVPDTHRSCEQLREIAKQLKRASAALFVIGGTTGLLAHPAAVLTLEAAAALRCLAITATFVLITARLTGDCE